MIAAETATRVSTGLQIENLTVTYARRPVLEQVCLSCERCQIVGLLGPNGSGKSTLLKSIVGLVPKTSGRVSLDGVDLQGGRSKARVAYVPQRSDVDWGFPINVEDVVLLGCQGRLGLYRRAGPAERAAAWAALERVEMSSHRHAQIGELSGGQQQRVFLARALAQGGDALLLDEPLTGLDRRTRELLLGVLDELRRGGHAIMLTTHDPFQAEHLCDVCYMLDGGHLTVRA